MNGLTLIAVIVAFFIGKAYQRLLDQAIDNDKEQN
jgi:hypothetical protein